MQEPNGKKASGLIIICSYHHNNTAKIAGKFSEVLNAWVLTPEKAIPARLSDYELMGFGAGIDSGMHYKPLLDLADKLPEVSKKPGFIFSTSAMQGKPKVYNDHSALRGKLQLKGYIILGEFSCKGFNTNGFLRYIGGMNKGKPDIADLRHAEEFAFSLVEKMCILQWDI